MNDCELEDIGINRTDIDPVFARTVPTSKICSFQCDRARSLSRSALIGL